MSAPKTESLEQELNRFMDAHPGANRGAVAADMSAKRGMPFNDPKEIQNDGVPIRDEALAPVSWPQKEDPKKQEEPAPVTRIKLSAYDDNRRYLRKLDVSPGMVSLITQDERVEIDQQRRAIYDIEKGIVERRMAVLYDSMPGWPIDIQNAFIEGEWHIVIPWMLSMGVQRQYLARELSALVAPRLKDTDAQT